MKKKSINMGKLFCFMVAWIPSRWVDEHETVLSREINVPVIDNLVYTVQID